MDNKPDLISKVKNKTDNFEFDFFEPLEYKGNPCFRVSFGELLERYKTLLITEEKITIDKIILLVRGSHVWMGSERFLCNDIVQKESDRGTPFFVLICKRKPKTPEDYLKCNIYEEYACTKTECPEVLPKLKGKPWNEYALRQIASLRPSALRVTKEGTKLDAMPWRVTVYLDDSNKIKEIIQEVRVGAKFDDQEN